jgi:hypothetical protein
MFVYITVPSGLLTTDGVNSYSKRTIRFTQNFANLYLRYGELRI